MTTADAGPVCLVVAMPSPADACGPVGRIFGLSSRGTHLLPSAFAVAVPYGLRLLGAASWGAQRRARYRGGDRQANAALHRIVHTRLRCDARTRDYYERRIKEGKTRREIIRCLKRYAAREVFHLVRPAIGGPPS